jgi:hypothetical protein
MKKQLSGTSSKVKPEPGVKNMGNRHTGFPVDSMNRIRQALIAGGLYKLAKRGLGKGLVGLALPAAALLIEDLSNPKGMVIPFFRWLLSRHGKVKIIEVSPKPLQKSGKGRERKRAPQGKGGGITEEQAR